MIIAVINTKGGVGKTTIAVNLAAALASSGRRILLVDLDSHAAASLWCGIARANLRPSSATCLLEQFPIRKAIRSTATPHLDVLTGSLELASADISLCHVRGRELVLRRQLEKVRRDYELVLLDCPAGLSLLAVNALTAADHLLIPVVPEPLSFDGLMHVFGSVDRVRTGLGVRSRIIGILVTMVEPKRKGARELIERLHVQYRDKMFHTEIRWNEALAHAPASRQHILAFAPRSSAADAFRRLAREVLQRLRPSGPDVSILVSGWTNPRTAREHQRRA